MSKIIHDHLSMNDQISELTPWEKDMMNRGYAPAYRGRIFEKDEFGNLTFKKCNTVVLGGALTALEKLAGVRSALEIPRIDSIDGNAIENNSNTVGQELADQLNSFVCLFSVGIGGAENTFGVVHTPDFKQNIISGIVPFRLNTTTTLDVPGLLPGPDNLNERKKYAGLVHVPNEGYRWYFKQFENPVTITTLAKNAPDITKDGTQIKSDSDLRNIPNGVGVESFIQCELRIDPNDIRPYFEQCGDANMARYNTIALYTAKKSALSDDADAFSNIRLFSVVNFDNEPVKIPKESTYVYRIYGAL